MNTVVEATSLSHISDIATHPPILPDTPNNIPRLPLVLYIARVPGSRDVFLTPIKPREKIVTAEDIQSSLYFVHVNCPDDFQDPPRRLSSANAEPSSLLPVAEVHIARKPALPARPYAPLTPPYPTHDDMPLPSVREGYIARKPVGGSVSVQSHPQSLDLPLMPHRPLPSPPRDDRKGGPSLPTHDVSLLQGSGNSDESNSYGRQFEPPTTSPNPSLLPEAGSLTLIRRDPASNDQWDVASIYDPPIHEVSSAALRSPGVAVRTKRGGAPLYLDISNPAYAQFMENDRLQPRPSTSSSSSSESEPQQEGIFRRRLYMPGSKYGEHAYSHQRGHSSNGQLHQSHDQLTHQRMRQSIDLNASLSSETSSADRRSRSYTFKSPWNGRCEFSTGATGRSLRCKHYWPSHSSGSVREVSELRFNLPTKSSKTATVLSEKRSSYFHRLHGRSEDGDDDIPSFIFGEDGKLDLTLGKEKAGGGFGGKQAKLGKLIIESEGLKMLDLLVAANVGLWWRAYDKL